MIGLIGKKEGMTQVFDEQGRLTPVTVIRVEPNVVVQKKEKEKFGYSSIVLGVGQVKQHRVSKPYAGQFKDGFEPVKTLKEFRDFDLQVSVGDKIGVEIFDKTRYLDVTSMSKGKGFQGVIKRYGFATGPNSHGSKFHRGQGTSGMCTSPGRSFKNTPMAGRTGFEKVTIQNLRIVSIDAEAGVVMVRGSVPGKKDSCVYLKSAVKIER